MSQSTNSQQTSFVCEEGTRKDIPVEDYDDARCVAELHLANYIQSLHHEAPRYNYNQAIYHGINRTSLHNQTRENLDVSTALAVLMDNTADPETASAVSISIYGGSRTAGFELPKKELEKQMPTKNLNRQIGVCRIRVEVHVAQGRDEVPQDDLQNLHKVLVEVDRFHQLFDAPALSERQQNREIGENILPAIVNLSEAKIMLILQQLPLIHRAWHEMILENHPEDCQIPMLVEEIYTLIHELASAALSSERLPEEQHRILAHIIHLAYDLRSTIDGTANILDAMERNWARILSQQLHTGILPETGCVVPHKYRGESFRGWRAQPLYEEPDTDEDNSDSDATAVPPAKISRVYDRHSLSQELVKEYVAHNGIYSRLCPRFRDGQPLNPITYWLGALGKYWLAAKTLLYIPLFPSAARRPKHVEVNIIVRGVPPNWFARYSPTASGRPDVPQTFDQFVHLQTEMDLVPDRGYGSTNVRRSFERDWQEAIHQQCLFVHPELKLLVFNAIEWRFVRQLILFHKEDKQLLDLHYVRNIKDAKKVLKHVLVIGTSRDICFSCRAFIRGWNGVYDEETLEDGEKRTWQCHCANMVMGYRCDECEEFDDEPLRTKLRFIVGSGGDPRTQKPRNHEFDPSWIAPKLMKPVWLKLAKGQLAPHLEPFLETINQRTELAIRMELHGLLGEGEMQTLLEYAADDGFGDRTAGEFDPHTHQIREAKDFFLVPNRIYREEDTSAIILDPEEIAESQSTVVQHLGDVVEQNRSLVQIAQLAQQIQSMDSDPAETRDVREQNIREIIQYPGQEENRAPPETLLPPANTPCQYGTPINPYNFEYTPAPLPYEGSFYHRTPQYQLQPTPDSVPELGAPSTAVGREEFQARPLPTSFTFVPMLSGGGSNQFGLLATPGPFNGGNYYSTQFPYHFYGTLPSPGAGYYAAPGSQYPYPQTGFTFGRGYPNMPGTLPYPHLCYSPIPQYPEASAAPGTLSYWGPATTTNHAVNSYIVPQQTPTNSGLLSTRPTLVQGSGYNSGRVTGDLCNLFPEDSDLPDNNERDDSGAHMTSFRRL
ncbi:hypothetical protein EV426DRAFT_686139 [Tirmania nivea]|nr:hypothetical protein EV426DRAFT_686139 [Tirmania nivea]